MLNKPLTFKWLILFLMVGWSCSPLRQYPATYNKVIQHETSSESEYTLLSTTAIHTVQKGDTLYSIAKRYGVTLNELLRLNQLTTSSKLYPGQKLQVRAVTPSPTPAEPPSLSQKPTRQVAPSYGNSPPPVTSSTTPLKNKHCAPPVPWQWPTLGRAVENTTLNSNQGIRIVGSVGQAVRAAAHGIVTYSGTGVAGYDNLITIQHNDAFLSVYAHNRKRLVSQGTEVKSGQIIAEMGVDANKQPSLHFEIRCHGKAINPLPFLPQ